jgi:hypothetical protein
MNSQHARSVVPDSGAALADRSLEASDDYQDPSASPRYCPTGLLATFTLLMAGRGRCVNTDMMLGDREYAMWQLACARASDDDELRSVATRLFSYFDDPAHHALPVMGTA